MPTITITTDYDGHVNNLDYKNDDSFIIILAGTAGKSTYRSFMRFPLTNLPAGATVTQVRFRLNISTVVGGEAGLWDIHGYDTNGQTDPATESSYAHCASGNLYVDDDITWRSLGQTWITLGGNVCTDIQNAKSAVNRFSLGFHEEGDNDATPEADSLEKSDGLPAQLEITYTEEAPPPAVGYSYSDGLVTIQVAE